MTVGKHMEGETIYTFKIRHENYEGHVKDSLYVIPLDKGKVPSYYINVYILLYRITFILFYGPAYGIDQKIVQMCFSLQKKQLIM